MSFKKYPWYRFNRWLNQQPDNRIAGGFLPEHTVITNFLEAKINGAAFSTSANGIEVASHGWVAGNSVLPKWCNLLMAQLCLLSQGRDSYQARTVKKALKIVSKELREQKDGD